jgi:uncharacterized damage-inducible protein DinB
MYATAATLSDDERRRDLGAFFRSVHGTLGHILMADRVWLWRFTLDRKVGESRDRSGAPIALTGAYDQDLYPDFAELRRERARTDGDIDRLVAGLGAERLTAPLRYRTGAGTEYEHPLWWALLHFFNHQTHHRGQATTLLKQLGRDPGDTDLGIMLRTEAGR